MKTILLTTVHPAPYMNKVYDILSKDYKVEMAYHKRKDEYKTWKGFVGQDGLYLEDTSILKFWNLYRTCDLCIFGSWLSVHTIVTVLFSWIFKTKCGLFSDHPSPWMKKSLFYFFKKYILFRLTDYIFCATESTRRYYHENYNIAYDKLLLFPYSYDDKYTVENEDINSQREQLMLHSNERINVFIANNFIERKGYKAVVDAFTILNKTGRLSQYKIRIAGNGELFESVKNALESLDREIEFLGWIEPGQYTSLINNCDIYIHASVFEPFGIPPLDAMCRGKLVIVSNGVESVSALIKNGQDGYLFEANNGDQLAAILEKCDRKQIYSIGRRARISALATYNDNVYLNSVELALK